MRVAKVDVHPVEGEIGNETVHFEAVGKPEGYDADGSDEDNTFAKFTPSASLQIYIANPVLIGKHKEGDVYYVDFTPAD